jgi:hypothetical protein
MCITASTMQPQWHLRARGNDMLNPHTRDSLIPPLMSRVYFLREHIVPTERLSTSWDSTWPSSWQLACLARAKPFGITYHALAPFVLIWNVATGISTVSACTVASRPSEASAPRRMPAGKTRNCNGSQHLFPSHTLTTILSPTTRKLYTVRKRGSGLTSCALLTASSAPLLPKPRSTLILLSG